MNYKKMIFFIIITLTFLPSIVKADMGGVFIFWGIIFLIPFVILFSIILIIFQNYLIAYIPIKYYYKKQIKDKFKFLLFILKYSFIIGIIEIVLLPIIFLTTPEFLFFTVGDYFLLFAAIYSILSGIIIFFIFRQFFPKELKMKKPQINKLAFLMSILTNPIIVLLIIYVLVFMSI